MFMGWDHLIVFLKCRESEEEALDCVQIPASLRSGSEPSKAKAQSPLTIEESVAVQYIPQ
jgi:hypothetical protein